MDPLVRPLSAADAPELALLESIARTAMAAQRGGEVHLAETPEVGDWQPLVGHDDHPVWVAVAGDVPVGYLELAIRTDGVADVRQVYVHPDARELGFGDALLAAAIEHARTRGCRRLEGTALPGDRDTKNLYERAGITARKIVVSTPL